MTLAILMILMDGTFVIMHVMTGCKVFAMVKGLNQLYTYTTNKTLILKVGIPCTVMEFIIMRTDL